jgi:hypothetical protein
MSLINSMSTKLKIASLSVILSSCFFLLIVLLQTYFMQNIGWFFALAIAFLFVGINLKSNPTYKILGWSLIWTFVTWFTLLTAFMLLFLFSMGYTGC